MLISYAHTIKNMYNMTRSFENIIDTEKILCDFSFQNSYMYSSNKQELKNMFEHKAGNKTLNEWATAFCKRKYNSDFAKEMTRSVAAYLRDFEQE